MNTTTLTINSSTDMDNNSVNTYGFFFIDASGGNISLDLPITGINYGSYYEFVRTDSSVNTVTLNTKTGYTIGGSASLTLGISQYLYLINNGTDWFVVRFNRV